MDRGTIEIAFQIIVFLFAISVHESAHAWSADYFGDNTARLLGRVSLNPLRHIDPIGTLLVPALAMLVGAPLFGWAKPTPVNTSRLRHRRRDDMLVSAAGPISNLLIAFGAVVVYKLILLTTGTNIPEDSLLYPMAVLLDMAMYINVILAVFNLLPIPPLDGSHILEGLLPDSLKEIYAGIRPYGFLLLLVALRYLDLGVIYRPIMRFFDFILFAGT
jgi:Zn-dependent protease